MNAITYFPGCSLKDSAASFERSTVAVMERLGHPLEELPRWTCCGTVAALATDDLMHLVAAVRNFERAQKIEAEEIVAPCAMCFNTLRQVAMRVNVDVEARDKINAFMNEEEDYEGGVAVRHLLEILRDRVGWDAIEEKVTEPLFDLPVSAYYGCTLVRPSGVGIDDPAAPAVLGDLLEALGATVVKTPFDTECCGSYQVVDRRDLAVDRSLRILRAAITRGAAVIATSCPLCQYNLEEARRGALAEGMLVEATAPVVAYFTELMAAAMGLDEELLPADLRAAVVRSRETTPEGV
ncbi:MAG: CoB--CoM heterodisulfide reductase iron-sulfur subunit B family protein [Candidatus Bipolaricaulota bacterium]|nr:MAG: CoB--CoM heterodisulfide reductase iron-sulfur subunit B family protein [Candidatus Bipolaricaulota bacterium]